jgi:hypothetical protein
MTRKVTSEEEIMVMRIMDEQFEELVATWIGLFLRYITLKPLWERHKRTEKCQKKKKG